MGDAPAAPESTGDFQNASHLKGVSSIPLSNHGATTGSLGASQMNTSEGSYSYMPSYPSQQHASQVRQDSFGMADLGNALPDMSYQSYSNAPTPMYSAVSSPAAHAFQVQNMPQYSSSPSLGQSAAMPSNFPYQQQYQAHYASNHAPSPQHLQSGTDSMNHFYHNQAFMVHAHQSGSQFFIQPNQYIPQTQLYPGGAGAGQFVGRNYFSGDPRLKSQQRGSDYSSVGAPRRPSSIASSSGPSSVVRGPPRKPRQSGYAIWIGNLPPQTDLMSLVLHVCKETHGLQSLFLISKSNCAFANFKDEATCATAQGKIHDSRFQSVRLVSRLRRSSLGTPAAVSVPTGPAALTVPSNTTVAQTHSTEGDSKLRETDGGTENIKESGDAPLAKDKFFVVKSLTVEDLELSVRNGIWATQSHNENALNKAYKTADNVYLVFSANKSGEYFGYARMISPVNDDPAAAIEFAPKAQAVEDPELPRAIPTPATEFTPKGRIIDDSARGTIFWEAQRDELNEVEGADEEDEIPSSQSDQDDGLSPPKAWGKPFKIEWFSTTRLPFYRTRGLRNPWNSNREVKIARDGTELETAIGRRLLGLFHRLPSPTTQPVSTMCL